MKLSGRWNILTAVQMGPGNDTRSCDHGEDTIILYLVGCLVVDIFNVLSSRKILKTNTIFRYSKLLIITETWTTNHSIHNSRENWPFMPSTFDREFHGKFCLLPIILHPAEAAEF